MAQLELCVKGACKTKKNAQEINHNKKFLPELEKKLIQTAGRLTTTTKAYFFGESKKMASVSCNAIKNQQGNVASGLQFIQNHCQDVGYKMYCNMQKPIPHGQQLQSGISIKGVNVRSHLGIERPEDFLKVCSKKGFKNAVIHTVDDIDTLVILSFEQNYTFNTAMGILIGLDTNCWKGSGCKGKFFSLDGATLLDPIAKKFNKTLGKSFPKYPNHNALILSSGEIKTIRLNTSQISAIPCMSIDEHTFKVLTCEQT